MCSNLRMLLRCGEAAGEFPGRIRHLAVTAQTTLRNQARYFSRLQTCAVLPGVCPCVRASALAREAQRPENEREKERERENQ